MVSVASEDESSSSPTTNAINGGALSSTASSSSPSQLEQEEQRNQPAAAAATTTLPPFLTKTYDMIHDSSTDSVVSWGSKGASFVVWNPPEFARDLLPKYFKHNNFSSFVRQLNTYGFRKVDPDRWEFANEGFLRGHRQLLKGIHRRKPSSVQAQSHNTSHDDSTASGKLGLEAEVEKLNRDKNVLMLELVRLRQQQQQHEQELRIMGRRLQGTEQRQQHMITFLAKAIQSPRFLAHVGASNRGTQQIVGEKRKKLQLFASAAAAADEEDLKMVRLYDPDREKLVRFFSRSDLMFDGPLQVELLVRELLREQEPEEGEKAKRKSEKRCVEEIRSACAVSQVCNATSVLEGQVQASVDSGAVGVGFNDVFWERFLTDADGNSDKREN